MKRRINWRIAAILPLAILFLFCWWHWSAWRDDAWTASGFGARFACSCRQVEGRPMASCRNDFARLRGMGLVQLSDRADGRGVDAGIPILAHRTATLVPGFGCVLDR